MKLLRHPDLTMDVPDYFDNGDGYGAPPAASAERYKELASLESNQTLMKYDVEYAGYPY